jgi:hypothetical protein
MLTRTLLESYLGQPIKNVCPHGYDAGSDNHCAHFVAHVLQLDFGLTCAGMKGHRGFGGANIRVAELFTRCPLLHEVVECPTTGEGIIFVSAPSSFKHAPAQIANVKKKHVGLVMNGIVWHYSNKRHRVENEPVSEFLFHYPAQDNALWWGGFPSGARPTNFGTSS